MAKNRLKKDGNFGALGYKLLPRGRAESECLWLDS